MDLSRSSIKRLIKRVPLVGSTIAKIRGTPGFPGSAKYWEARYQSGDNSGAGSYGHLAQFKSEVLNAFVATNTIRSVLEFGCGDGNQLSLAAYPRYVGLDVSKSALMLCRKRFANDQTKSFHMYDPGALASNPALFNAELTLSLDVIFHLIEDDVYEAYMTNLFASATRYVIVYSSDADEQTRSAHVRHRRFTAWVAGNCADSSLVQKIPNRYPFERDDGLTSFADFYIFRKHECA